MAIEANSRQTRILAGPQGPPGPPGVSSIPGPSGPNGIDAVTTLTSSFTQPAVNGTVVVAVGQTGFLVVGATVFVASGGYYTVTAIGSGISATLQNTGATGNASPGATVPSAGRVAPAGLPGAAGATGANAGLYTAYGSRPAAGQAGRIAIYSDATNNVMGLDTGSTWRTLIPPFGHFGEPAPGNTDPFTRVNGGSNLITETCILGQIQAAAATAGSTQNLQTWQVAKTGNLGPRAWLTARSTASTEDVGVFIRDSSGGKLVVLAAEFAAAGLTIVVLRYTNLTTFSATSVTVSLDASKAASIVAGGIGLRIRDDGTNFNFEYSFDNFQWFSALAESRTAWVPSAGDKAGLVIAPFSNPVTAVFMGFDMQ